MTRDVEESEEKTPEEAVLQQASEELAQVQERIGPHFRRAETRSRAGRYLRALLAPVERKNGWQLAEELRERDPHGAQRLLAEADWDEEAVRDELRSYVVEHLGEADGVLVVDETGFLKKGKKSAGVANQYSGAAYGLANSQVGVFLLYASPRGAAFLDRDLYLAERMAHRPRAMSGGGHPGEPCVDPERGTGQTHAGTGLCRPSPCRVGGGRHALWLRRVAGMAGGTAPALRAGDPADACGLCGRTTPADRVSCSPLA
jgi:hypothetical protein